MRATSLGGFRDRPVRHVVATRGVSVGDGEIAAELLTHPRILQQRPSFVCDALSIDERVAIENALELFAVMIGERRGRTILGNRYVRFREHGAAEGVELRVGRIARKIGRQRGLQADRRVLGRDAERPTPDPTRTAARR